MPVPSSIADLSTTAGSNSPSGSESPSTADDYFRSHASFIARLRSVVGGATDSDIPSVANNLLAEDDPTKGAGLVVFDKTLAYTGGVGAGLLELYAKAARINFSDDHGVDPTGVASSAAAIQALFAAARAGGKVAVIRPGTYLIDGECDYSGLTVLAHGASFKIDHSGADPTQDVTGFRAKSSDSHWDGGAFDLVGTSFNQGNAANINGTRQGGFWIGEYYKAGALTRIERVSLRNQSWRSVGGWYGCNQIQLTGNLSGVELDQIHGDADGRAGHLIAFEWGKDTTANKTYHPENISIGVVTGTGYRQKFHGSVLFLSGVCDASVRLVRGVNSAQVARIVGGDNGETLALPQYAGRVLRGIHLEVISGSSLQWRAVHISGRGEIGNTVPQVSIGTLFASGEGGTAVGGYFEGTSASYAGGETGSYSALGMKAVYKAFGAVTIENMVLREFGGYGLYVGISADADASANSFGSCKVASIDAQNIGGPAYYMSPAAASVEMLRIDEISAIACSLSGSFTSNLDCFGGYSVDDGDLTKVADISIGGGRIGATGSGATFGIRSTGGAVRANYYGLKVGNGTVFSTAVSHGSGASADRVTHVGCDFVGTTAYGGKAAVGSLS